MVVVTQAASLLQAPPQQWCDPQSVVTAFEEHKVTTALWLVFVIGVMLGYQLSRWRTENRRARYDQDRIWGSRRDYR